jgi:hypothetical protein
MVGAIDQHPGHAVAAIRPDQGRVVQPDMRQVAEQVVPRQLAGKFLQPLSVADVHHVRLAFRVLQMEGAEPAFRHLEGEGREQLLDGGIPPVK